ncbi:Signal recognition particle receptor subunit beta [Balamuthia mandrillaris]
MNTTTDYYAWVEGWTKEQGLPPEAAPLLLFGAPALILLLLLILFFTLFAGKSKARNTILLLGPSGSGKTALFFRLKEGKVVETHTSMKENDSSFALHSDKKGRPVHVIDFPGHQRLRSQLHTFLPLAKGIVFLTDATEFKSEVSKAARYLFDLFGDKQIQSRKVPFLIVCNKTEMITAAPKDDIQRGLEEEIDQLRKSQSTMEDIGGSSAEERRVAVGVEGEAFKMEQLPFPVSFVECSVKQGDILPIEQFIRKLIP